MAVEVVLNIDEHGKKKMGYPWLGRHDSGMIVFFHEPRRGAIVAASAMQPDFLGFYGQEWDESEFTPLSPSESITLRNV